MSNVQVYMQIKANGSDVAGSSEDKQHHEDWCDVLSYKYAVSKGDSGTTASRRAGRTVAGEFEIFKPLDKASPLLLQALCQNQTLEIEIQCWRDKEGGGGRENFYSWKLNNARLTSYSPYTPMGDSADQANPYQERLGVVAAEIVAIHQEGGIEYQHDFTTADA